MNRMPSPLAIAITSALTISLSGCFSSSSSSNSDGENTQSGLSGTAATGAPLVGADVCLRAGNADSSEACTLSTSTDNDGQYQFSDDELADLERPFHVSVRGDSAAGNPVTLSSAASSDSQTTSNITPLTEALLYAASDGDNGLEIAASRLADLDLPNAQQGLRSVLANALSRLGIDANVDFIEDDDFAADRTGVDLMLDLVEIDQYDLNGDGSPRIQLTERGNRSNRIVLKWDNAGIEIDEDNSTPESEFLEHSVDLTDIDGFYDALLVVMGSGDADATDDLLHKDALDNGETREDLRDLISDDDGFFSRADSFGTVNVSGCSTADICNAGVRVFDEDGDEFYTLQLDLKRTSGDWLLYGNQRDHDFKLQPYADRFINVSAEEPNDQGTGLQLLLNPSDHMNKKVHTAVISAKRGEDKVELYTLSDCEDGTEDWLCLQNEEGDKAGGNMISMNTEDAADMTTDDGNYILALKDEHDDTIATYEDLGLKTAPFRGTPDAYDNNYASLSDASIDALKAVDSTTEALELSWEIKEGLRVDELIIDFHIQGNTDSQRLVDRRYRSFEDGDVINLQDFEEDVTDFDSLILISRDSLGRTYFNEYLP